MAIALVSNARQVGSTVASFTMTVDVGSGSNRLLVVCLLTRSSVLQTVTAMTYNGVALSQAVYVDETSTSLDLRAEIWYLANPTSGSNTLSVTWASTVAQYECNVAWF